MRWYEVQVCLKKWMRFVGRRAVEGVGEIKVLRCGKTWEWQDVRFTVMTHVHEQ